MIDDVGLDQIESKGPTPIKSREAPCSGRRHSVPVVGRGQSARGPVASNKWCGFWSESVVSGREQDPDHAVNRFGFTVGSVPSDSL